VNMLDKALGLELVMFLSEGDKKIALNCSRNKLEECLAQQSKGIFSFFRSGVDAKFNGDCITVQSRPSLKALSSTHYFEGKICEENGRVDLVGKIKAKLYVRVPILIFVNVCILAAIAALVNLLLEVARMTDLECVSCHLNESFAYFAVPMFLLAFCWLISRLLFYIDGSGRVENYFKRSGLLLN